MLTRTVPIPLEARYGAGHSREWS